MAGHRYWSINAASTLYGGYTSIAEIAMATSPGGANALTGGTPSASSVQGSGYEANKALDGNLDTWWNATNTSPARWVYDFGVGNAPTIVEHRITVRRDSQDGANTGPQNWTLEYSDDGTAWTSQQAYTSTWTPGQQKTFAVSSTASLQVEQSSLEVVSTLVNVRAQQASLEVVSTLVNLRAQQAFLEVIISNPPPSAVTPYKSSKVEHAALFRPKTNRAASVAARRRRGEVTSILLSAITVAAVCPYRKSKRSNFRVTKFFHRAFQAATVRRRDGASSTELLLVRPISQSYICVVT